VGEILSPTDIEANHTHDEELRGVDLSRPLPVKGLSDAAFSSLQARGEEERDGVAVILASD